MARQSHIPIGFLKWSVQEGNNSPAKAVVWMKMTCGAIIKPKEFKRRDISRLLELNLLGYDERTNRYHQRTWAEILRILEIREMTFVRITHATIAKYKLKDLAYSAVLQYMLRLQKDGGTHSGKPSKRGVLVHPSIQLGGIAHSLMQRQFNKSLRWSQDRRRSCEACGLIRFTRRRVKADNVYDKIQRLQEVTSYSDVRVLFTFSVPKFLRHRLERRIMDPKQGCYVYVQYG